jgi:hypothetical protein
MKLKFPRPRFGLKILFVIIALVAIFCGYQMNWIRQRHQFLALHNINPPDRTLSGTWYLLRDETQPWFDFMYLFGERKQDYVELVFDKGFVEGEPSLTEWKKQLIRGHFINDLFQKWYDDEVAVARNLFPEATIFIWRRIPLELHNTRP